MPTKTKSRILSPFYGGEIFHFSTPPLYIPPNPDPELARAADERIRQTFKSIMGQRSARLAQSLAYDVARFVGLRCDEKSFGDAQIVTLLAYRILARCKLLADARLVSASPDDGFERLFYSVYYGSSDEQDWSTLKKCMEGVAAEADNTMLRQHFDDIWNVLQPAMRRRTPHHWLRLFYCAWQTSCDDWPPYTCLSRVRYARKLRHSENPAKFERPATVRT